MVVTEAIVTGTAAAIVTALADGPCCTARDLSQRLVAISYANIRQRLHRLAEAGIVTKLRRGLYGLDCDSGREGSAPTVAKPDKPRPFASPRGYSPEQIAAAVARATAHFEAMNDMHRPEAWA
jgi:DNA-binding transcriptional ArsR family regulator